MGCITNRQEVSEFLTSASGWATGSSAFLRLIAGGPCNDPYAPAVKPKPKLCKHNKNVRSFVKEKNG